MTVANLACSSSDDAHDGGEALAAQRAAARLIPQHRRAFDTQPAVTALEEDGVGGPLHAHEAGAAFVRFGVRLLAAAAAVRVVLAGSSE